jgi:hypothetical protein
MPGIDLQQLFKQHAFESVLWITTEPATDERKNNPNIEFMDATQIGKPETLQGHWDLVIIDEVLLNLPRDQVIQTISRLRDLHARRLVILFPDQPDAPCSIKHEDLISLGFRALESQPGIFYHDLYDYKDTPDWLNNQYWANPENWDKYRW